MTAAERHAARWHARLEAAMPGWLLEFLPRQRWFGGKARGLSAARLEDAAWLEAESMPLALAVVEVRYAEGPASRYAMLLGLAADAGALPVLGRLEDGGESPWVVEAMLDPSGARALLSGFDPPGKLRSVHGATLAFGDVDPASDRRLRREALEAGPLRGLGVEQSNTSVAVGRRHIFKLFRQLEPGENPEVEMGRFLTRRTGFRAMPGLRGSLSWAPGTGPPLTAGVLQDWVESRGDGWSYVLARLREIVDGAGAPEPLARDLLTLGAVTGEFHAALASDASQPDFAPEPVSAADLERWAGDVAGRARRVRGMLARGVDALPAEVQRLARTLLERDAELAARLRPPEATGGRGFHKIRIHGDYHLGQTLKTPEGFVLIDFEGEPARPLAERRAKQCALKDVAGMLRSFDYAVETVRRPSGAPASSAPPLREAFLEGYLARVSQGGAGVLPEERAALAAWLDFFEIEKALYEVEYELNHRPDWLSIPIWGILHILGRR